MPTKLNFDELHTIGRQVYEETENLPKEEKKKKVIDDLLDYLIFAWTMGYQEIEEVIGDLPVEVDPEELADALEKKIDGKTLADRIRKRIDDDEWDLDIFLVIVETEFLRMLETAKNSAAVKAEKLYDLTLYKTWQTMLDDRVRDTHDYLEGMTKELHEEFVTYNGDTALYPHGFGVASEDINCRCTLKYWMRRTTDKGTTDINGKV